MSKTNSQTLALLLMVGLMLVLIPATAKADFVNFSVDEGTVPGALPNVITVNKLNGGYIEKITFDGLGGFKSAAYTDFGQYYDNNGVVDSQLNSFGEIGYKLYATFTAVGTASGTTFTGTSAEIHIYIDPDKNTTKALGATGGDPITLTNTSDDYEIMYSYDLIKAVGSFDPADDMGSFDFTFGSPTLTDPKGMAYWPDLPQIYLQAVVDGDFDTFTPTGNLTVRGDVSAVFQVVPEPSTLILFGLGLVGTAVAVRRKR